MTQTREAGYRIFIATSGTGKTTDIKAYLNDKRRNLIVPSGRDDVAWHGIPELKWRVEMVDDPWRPGKQVAKCIVPELNTFTGTRVLHVDGDARIFDALIDPVTGIRNARVVLDDFRNYIYSSGQLRKEVVAFLNNRRHKMLDLFLACHQVEDVARKMLALNPKLIIGYTTSPPTDTSLAKVPNGELLLETIERVNRINLAKPEGKRYYKEMVQM